MGRGVDFFFMYTYTRPETPLCRHTASAVSRSTLGSTSLLRSDCDVGEMRAAGIAFLKAASGGSLKRLRVGGVPEHFNTPWHTVRRSPTPDDAPNNNNGHERPPAVNLT